MSYDIYDNPLTGRYAGVEMSRNWSPRVKHVTWRRLWIALARAEKKFGLAISDEQLAELEAHAEDIDFAAAEAWEKQLRHDVMGHIRAYAEQCPKAGPIIHLGATSCYVTDNGDLIQTRNGLKILRRKLLAVIAAFARQAETWRELPTLGFTHYQPAQLTTLGKRLCLYLQDFLMDLTRLEREIERLPFRGVKGTTGTQASFLALFDGDHAKVQAVDRAVAAEMGFDNIIPVSGQTYTRKVDYFVLTVLSGIAQSAAKFAGDLRLSANLREWEEPFGKSQVGSSAMAYKRNPMRSERVCALARHLMSLPINAAFTHAGQWFERTLDDSANRRIVLPEAFLEADIILSLVHNIVDGLTVWPKVIASRVTAELPFMATENILMAAVKKGGDRQALHEAIRELSMESARRVKEEGAANDLLDRIRADARFAAVRDDLDRLLNPRDFIGRAPEQVRDFLDEMVYPTLERYKDELKDASGEAVTV